MAGGIHDGVHLRGSRASTTPRASPESSTAAPAARPFAPQARRTPPAPPAALPALPPSAVMASAPTKLKDEIRAASQEIRAKSEQLKQLVEALPRLEQASQAASQAVPVGEKLWPGAGPAQKKEQLAAQELANARQKIQKLTFEIGLATDTVNYSVEQYLLANDPAFARLRTNRDELMGLKHALDNASRELGDAAADHKAARRDAIGAGAAVLVGRTGGAVAGQLAPVVAAAKAVEALAESRAAAAARQSADGHLSEYNRRLDALLAAGSSLVSEDDRVLTALSNGGQFSMGNEVASSLASRAQRAEIAANNYVVARRRELE